MKDEAGHDGGIIYYRVALLKTSMSFDRLDSALPSAASSSVASNRSRTNREVTGFTVQLTSSSGISTKGQSRCLISYNNVSKTSLAAPITNGSSSWKEALSFPFDRDIASLKLELFSSESGQGETSIGRSDVNVGHLARYTKGRPYSGSIEVV